MSAQDAYSVDMLERKIAAKYDPEGLPMAGSLLGLGGRIQADGRMYKFVKQPPPTHKINLKTPIGEWRPHGSSKIVKNSKGEEVATKASYSYYCYTSRGAQRTPWERQEFVAFVDQSIALQVTYKNMSASPVSSILERD
ncbi:unnamed protein product [Linum trigynum]|uniref:NAC domain-containing protein n=1 Tax=Linum trigynum TaxID=586398 RepID=A0AAV2CRG0_9ROSI